MTPADFRGFANSVAAHMGFPESRVVLGGDHLGPHVWRLGRAHLRGSAPPISRLPVLPFLGAKHGLAQLVGELNDLDVDAKIAQRRRHPTVAAKVGRSLVIGQQ